MRKIIGTVLLLSFVVIQFFRPDKNTSNENTYHMASQYEIPTPVEEILKVSCYDCHSNQTRYPWYSQVQPVAWWLNGHIEHAKGDLNFSEFTKRRIAVQHHKLEEIVEMVEEHEMPLPSYTYLGLHQEAKLTEAQRKTLIDWAKGHMVTLKKNYPPDSLKMRRRPKPTATTK